MAPAEGWTAEARAHHRETGLPLVTLTWAQSLDGSLAQRRDAPLVLSGPESKAFTHRLRAAHDAILVGIGTVLADDPRLTARRAGGPDPRPVVLDSRLRFPLGARLLERPDAPWIATLAGADPERAARLEAAGVHLLPLPPDPAGRVSLPHLLRCLGEQGVTSLMVEGGARVLTAFLGARIADRIIITIAPRFVGGLNAIESAAGPDLALPYLVEVEYKTLGADLIVSGTPSWP
jgi:3,4-dihydroxy 2-butanone 4-phosphate synthase/GTP cyclohydrolase II